jgi:predicted permease
LLDNIADGTMALFAAFLILGCVLILTLVWIEEEGSSKEDKQTVIKWLKRVVIAEAVIGLIMCITPSKETMYQMLVAKLATYDNLQLAGNTIQEAFDYIINSISTLASNT